MGNFVENKLLCVLRDVNLKLLAVFPNIEIERNTEKLKPNSMRFNNITKGYRFR
jgi:hypothetical protein